MEHDHMLLRPGPPQHAQKAQAFDGHTQDEKVTRTPVPGLGQVGALLPALAPPANNMNPSSQQSQQHHYRLQGAQAPLASSSFIYNNLNHPSHQPHTSVKSAPLQALHQHSTSVLSLSPLSPPPSTRPLAQSQSHSHSRSHDPLTLSFPDAPSTELAPIQPHNEGVSGANNTYHTLPSLSSVTGGAQQHQHSLRQSGLQSPKSSYPSSPPRATVKHWPSLNPLTAYYTPSHVEVAESIPALPQHQIAEPQQQKMDVDMTGALNGAVSPPGRPADARASSVSLDDPDVRLAAEALGDLRAGMRLVSRFTQSISHKPPSITSCRILCVNMFRMDDYRLRKGRDPKEGYS
jgi:hypothetical protein